MPSERTGRAKNYTQCYACDGYIGNGLLDEDHYNNECPLCGATGLIVNE